MIEICGFFLNCLIFLFSLSHEGNFKSTSTLLKYKIHFSFLCPGINYARGVGVVRPPCYGPARTLPVAYIGFFLGKVLTSYSPPICAPLYVTIIKNKILNYRGFLIKKSLNIVTQLK